MAMTITRDVLRRAIDAANTECRDSEIAANQLTKMGYTNVRRYAEGKQDWQEGGLQLVMGAEVVA